MRTKSKRDLDTDEATCIDWSSQRPLSHSLASDLSRCCSSLRLFEPPVVRGSADYQKMLDIFPLHILHGCIVVIFAMCCKHPLKAGDDIFRQTSHPLPVPSADHE
ncbi:hypothetical protein J6590_014985 [Homalodisca vitripennis]|nr:hypothetical protein J6590_014985 [Homalodisca vitripennis]